jgi:hypothetical protein
MMKPKRTDCFCRKFLSLFLSFAFVAVAALPAAAESEKADCVFMEGPDIRPTVLDTTGTISQCPCVLTGIVKNASPDPAYYVHVVVSIWNTRTGDLTNMSWVQVGNGTLEPGQEQFIRFPLAISSLNDPDYEHNVTVRWKKSQYSKQDVDCVVDSAITQYDGNLSAFLFGFVKNVDSEPGFAPRLKARVLDDQGKTANIVAANMPHIPLDPGETLPFSVAIPAVAPTDVIDLSMEQA